MLSSWENEFYALHAKLEQIEAQCDQAKRQEVAARERRRALMRQREAVNARYATVRGAIERSQFVYQEFELLEDLPGGVLQISSWLAAELKRVCRVRLNAEELALLLQYQFEQHALGLRWAVAYFYHKERKWPRAIAAQKFGLTIPMLRRATRQLDCLRNRCEKVWTRSPARENYERWKVGADTWL